MEAGTQEGIDQYADAKLIDIEITEVGLQLNVLQNEDSGQIRRKT
jgi:hypothetical protein